MNAKAPNWYDIKSRASKPQLWYLNDHVGGLERFRIDSRAGGQRTLWKAKTSLKKMQETKRYIEKCWGC